jgi:predicted Rossmann fold nucleotide-binding protein DprA/Smf involved in DNA uptake
MICANLPAKTQATLLLCGGLAPTRRDEPAEPLNVGEFNLLIRTLERDSRSLSHILDPAVMEALLNDSSIPVAVARRVELLINRQVALRMAMERWSSLGFWVIDRADSRYPKRIHALLGQSAPPLLYGAGDHELLNASQIAVAVVGSRDIDEEAEGFAQDVGRCAAAVNAITVSGGARGVDRAAIDAALAEQGHAIAVLPGSLEQVAGSRAYRRFIADGHLLVVSPYHPGAKFTAGNAMGRNRLIYCMADAGIVVETAEGSGGTWSGATEVLKHGWIPIGVRRSEPMSAGNDALMKRGAYSVPNEVVTRPDQFTRWIDDTVSQHLRTSSESDTEQLELFGN